MSDTQDLLTIDEARSALNISEVAQDARIARMITAISKRIVDLCGPVVIVTTTNEAHDGGRSFIRPYETPVDSVASVTEYLHTTEKSLTAETNVSKPADGYMLDNPWTHEVRIIRRSGGADAPFPVGRRNVLVTYDAGRYADTANVDDKFKEACAAMLRRVHNREAAAWAQGGDPFTEPGVGGRGFFKAVDPMIAEFLADETFVPGVA